MSMTQYTTVAKLKARYPTHIEDLNNAADAIIIATISDVSARIDGYLIGVCALPITDATVLAILTPHANILVFWDLLGNALQGQNHEAHERSVKASITYLEKVAKGEITLVGADPQEIEVDESEGLVGSETVIFGEPD